MTPDPLAEARRIIANPELVLSSGEWRKLVGGILEAEHAIYESLCNLSFACFAGLGTQAPGVDVYNKAFKTVKKYEPTT